MTVLAINPKAIPGALASGDQRMLAQLGAQLARVDSRVSTLEARRMELGANSIDNGNLQAGSVNGTTIYPGSIVTSHISVGGLDASIITTGVLGAAVVNAISINASQIVAGNINTAQLQANVINAIQANVSTLSGIFTNMGAITAGSITGATVQTASGLVSRVVMDSAGLRGYASDGVTKAFELNTGTGILSATGVITLNPGSLVPGPALYGAQLGGGNIVPNSSFEQGNVPGDSTDRRAEGWETTNATGTGYGPSTAFAFHGSNSFKAVAVAAANMWVGRRTTTGNRMPAQVSRPYTISAWFYNPGASSRGVRFFYYFMDNSVHPAGVQSSSSGVNVQGTPSTGTLATLPPGQWTRVTFTTPAAPTGTTTIGALAHWDNATVGEVQYVDAFQIEMGDTPTAYAPKPDEILYSSLRSVFIGAGEIKANNILAGTITAQQLSFAQNYKNLVQDPSFEYTTLPTYWTATNGTLASATAITNPGVTPQDGGVFARVTAAASGAIAVTSAASKRPGVVGGQAYVFSIYVRKSTATAHSTQCSLTFYDASGVQTGTTTAGGTVSPTTAGWTRMSVNAAAPFDAASVGLSFGSTTSLATSEVMFFDAAQLELGAAATTFDAGWFMGSGLLGPTNITPGSITSNEIKAGSIQADRLTVSTLSAITADMGAITAGTITGVTVQTAASGNRVVIDASGLRMYDASGTNVAVNIPSSGADVTLAGGIQSKGIEFVGRGVSSTRTYQFGGSTVGTDQIVWSKDAYGGQFLGAIWTDYSPSIIIRSNLMVKATAPDNSASASLSVLDSSGASAFLQMGSSLRNLIGDTKIECGTGLVSFTGSTISNTAVITHGMPRTPKAVWVQFHDTGTTALSPVGNVFSVGATTFSVIGANATAVSGFSPPFFWIAVA